MYVRTRFCCAILHETHFVFALFILDGTQTAPNLFNEQIISTESKFIAIEVISSEEGVMKRRDFWALLAVVLLACSSAAAQKITTFDAPGAGTGSGQGTLSEGISDLGITYGYYIDVSGVAHGFLRFPNGGFDTFDVPGAGTAAGQGTFAFSLNPEITLAGYYIDGNEIGRAHV